jgi:hypothetical protein
LSERRDQASRSPPHHLSSPFTSRCGSPYYNCRWSSRQVSEIVSPCLLRLDGFLNFVIAMASHVGTGGTPPQSVESITRIAQNYEYNSSVRLRYWLRTAATILREVGCFCLHLVWFMPNLVPLGTHLRIRRTRRTSIPSPLPTRPADLSPSFEASGYSKV